MGADGLSRALLDGVRDLKGAREAFQQGDTDYSKECHSRPVDDHRAHAEAHMSAGGDVVRSVVFGGLDGIVTMFALLAGCVGARTTVLQTVTIGVGNLIADAFAMGYGEYVSSKAEEEYVEGETKREKWEMYHYPEGERKEMITLYMDKYGFTSQDAEIYVDIGMQYPDYFLQHMMFEELGLTISDSCTSPRTTGFVMFLSFLFHGLIPLGGFLLLSYLLPNNDHAFYGTCIMTICTLLCLGYVKAQLSGQPKLKSAVAMAANGAIASTAAYAASSTLRALTS